MSVGWVWVILNILSININNIYNYSNNLNLLVRVVHRTKAREAQDNHNHNLIPNKYIVYYRLKLSLDMGLRMGPGR